MRLVLLLFLASSAVTAQSKGDDDTVGDRTAVGVPLGIGVGHEEVARINCNDPFDCELMPYNPVCGSDGITYVNDCVFAIEFCSMSNAGKTLFIEILGACPPSDNEEQDEAGTLKHLGDEELDDAANAVNGGDAEVDPLMVFCSITCRLTPDQVCGTDGVTYINDCHLLSSKCEHPELEKASHGPCTNTIINLNTLEVDDDTDGINDSSTPAPEKCNPMCERNYDPICGSDAITYANSCLLEYAACRNPSVKPFGAGKCPPHMQAARGPSSTSNNNIGASCIPGPCPYTYAPVCGSDGQTHDNLCLFANARCEHPQHALTVVHDGECDADTQLTCETMTCPTFSECREQTEADDTVVAYCADVCSADRCSEREDCELVASDCYTAPCSPIAMCIPKVLDS